MSLSSLFIERFRDICRPQKTLVIVIVYIVVKLILSLTSKIWHNFLSLDYFYNTVMVTVLTLFRYKKSAEFFSVNVVIYQSTT